jgi:hypothetical protein
MGSLYQIQIRQMEAKLYWCRNYDSIFCIHKVLAWCRMYVYPDIQTFLCIYDNICTYIYLDIYRVLYDGTNSTKNILWTPVQTLKTEPEKCQSTRSESSDSLKLDTGDISSDGMEWLSQNNYDKCFESVLIWGAKSVLMSWFSGQWTVHINGQIKSTGWKRCSRERSMS